jgi:hypothetical protein
MCHLQGRPSHFVVVAVAPRYQLCAAVVAEVAVLLMAARLHARYYVCCVYALFIDAVLAQQYVGGLWREGNVVYFSVLFL